MVVGSPIVLNLIPGGVMPVIMINETDKGYQKEFLIYNGNTPYNVPGNVSATIRGTKRDGLGVTEAATVTAGSNVVRITVTEQMTAVPGENIFELVFVDTNGLRVATINFIMRVERSALNANTVISESDIAYSEQVLNQLQGVEAYYNKFENEKITRFLTCTDMKASTSLRSGMICQTAGYYAINDGGAAKYYIMGDAPIPDHYETLQNGLIAVLLPGNYVTAEMFGAHGDDTADDTAALNTAVQWAVTYGIPLMLLPKTYLVTGTINVLGQARIRGFNNTLSKIRYTGSGVCLDVTSWAEISGLYLLCDNSVDTETVGINVDNAEVGDSGTRTHIRIENCRIGKFRKSGINLDNHWQVVIDNCYFDGFGQNSGRNNVGIRFDYSGDVLSGWSGSGDLITNCYFRLCDYGIYNRGGWDLTVMNSIFEYNGYGIYKQEQGNATTLIGCWFENNSTAGVCGKAFAVINCRNKDQLDMSSDSRYIAIFGTSENEINSTLGIGRGGKMRVWGFAAPAKSSSVPVEAVSLECFGRYYANSTFGYHLPAEDDDYMVGRLILQAIGNGANSGQAVGILSFLSGRKAEKADASFAPIEVFRVNNHGSILPMNRANDLPTIGSADYRYGHAYLDAVSIKGDDGNYYQIKVNSSGTLYTTRL